MASATPILHLLTRSRGRSFFLPREHGAWGMLLVPLVTGAAAGNPRGERIIWILLFAAVALGLFCLRTPVEAGLEISPLRPQNDAERRLIHIFHLYLCFRCRLGPGSPHSLGARLWTPAVRRGRGDSFSSSGRPETTRPGNPHERPIDGRHRAELHGGGSLLPGDGPFRPDGRHHLVGQLALRRQPNSFRSTSNSFRASHDARGKTPPGKRLPASPSRMPASPGIDLASRMAPRSHPGGIRTFIRPRVRVVSRIAPATPGPSAGGQ